MQQIPLQAIPAQAVRVILDSQNCAISVYQKAQGLFADVAIGSTPVVSSVLARDAVPIVCRGYAGLSGNLVFIDTQGSDDPSYSSLGSRFVLVYLTAAEYAKIV